ncbi:hypothetical protein AGDE_03065 [Angomonas deanei]|uniref:TLD, putative n=1 Tax=Angomonas deanei TaxID=59799 RepID=S9VH70_9TRYP|nr:hypothetical protein AGDE_03739 [Angomonas deanei]EPY40861.1 hypothetical protein AGDE_03065 [Angomonas deanei]CAD2214324.1 TLD, putative [Angomonas deanei]|eukprot:EPY40189.1 hypothetical protein AGDE_03739 [Angomonas deanei]
MYLFDVHPLSDKIGIGMGGKDGYFGWFLDRWLDKGYCMGARCSTFKNPRLTTTEEWPVDSVEAYAVQTNEVSRLRVSGNSGDGNPSSILNNDPDREVDKVLLELHGVHRFDNHERTECLYAE